MKKLIFILLVGVFMVGVVSADSVIYHFNSYDAASGGNLLDSVSILMIVTVDAA